MFLSLQLFAETRLLYIQAWSVQNACVVCLFMYLPTAFSTSITIGWCQGSCYVTAVWYACRSLLFWSASWVLQFSKHGQLLFLFQFLFSLKLKGQSSIEVCGLTLPTKNLGRTTQLPAQIINITKKFYKSVYRSTAFSFCKFQLLFLF